MNNYTNIKFSGLWPRIFDRIHRGIKDKSHNFYWLKGGRGSGKSSFLSLEILTGIINDPRANAIIYRKVADTIGETVYNQMLWALDRLMLKPYFKCKVSPYKMIYLPTGQEIVFKGCDDPQKSKSIKPRFGYFKYLWFEEMTDFAGIEEIETIIQSIARGEGYTAVVGSYNPPKSANNWTNAEAMKHSSGRLVHHSSYKDLPREWLGEQFILIAEQMKAENELKYRHIYEGEVTGTGGEVFDNIEIREITDDEINTFGKIYTGVDHGFAVDPVAINQMHYNSSKRELYLFKEFFKVGASLDMMADFLKNDCGNEYATADSAEPRSNDELKQRGCKIIPAKKGPGSIEHGIKWLQDLRKIVIDPKRCPNAAQEFSGYEYETDKYGNFKASYPDYNNHTIDSTRYALENVFSDKRLKTIKGLKV